MSDTPLSMRKFSEPPSAVMAKMPLVSNVALGSSDAMFAVATDTDCGFMSVNWIRRPILAAWTLVLSSDSA